MALTNVSSIFCLVAGLLLMCMVKNMDTALFSFQNQDEKPVIAVIGERLQDQNILKKYPQAVGRSYIAASYVKYIELAGGRVLPISDETNVSDIGYLFKNTNGVLFPGGATNLLSSGYQRIAQAFFNLIIEEHRHSRMYPLIAICLGLQQEATLIAGKSVLTRTESHNIGLPMQFTKNASTSKLFGEIPIRIKKTLSSTTAAFNNHHYSVLLDTFYELDSLRNFYNVLTTSMDKNGKEFIASMEAKDYPIFGLQWHPEKTLFEWDPVLNITRSEDAIIASQYIADRFVSFARQSEHSFSSSLEDKLIYNYTPLFTGDISHFEQIYVL